MSTIHQLTTVQSRRALPALHRQGPRFDSGILATVELGLSNCKLEGLHGKVRLINHRGYGDHTAAALIAMIYLCAGSECVVLDRVPPRRLPDPDFADWLG